MIKKSISPLLFVCLLCGAIPLRGQTLFEWSPRRDSTRILDIYECVARVERARDSLSVLDPIWRDTMPVMASQLTVPVPSMVANIARRCTASISPAHVAPKDFKDVFWLYLTAGRDADARTLERLHVESIPTANVQARALALDSIASIYGTMEPVRMSDALRVTEEIIHMGNALPFGRRINLYSGIFEAAKIIGDTTLLRTAGGWLSAIPATLTDLERQSPEFTSRELYVLQAHTSRASVESLDSLRQSTAAYKKFLQTRWAAFSKTPLPGELRVIGESAPALHGDFWFPTQPQADVSPHAGKVSLVIFDEPHGNPERIAVLKRILKRFPELAVTVAVQTEGYFGRVALPPAAEADSIRNVFFEFYKVPVTLSVSTTPFVTLQEPDRRKIEQPVANSDTYSFGHIMSPYGETFVVDRHGAIVYGGLLMRLREAEFVRVIDAVMQQK